MAFIKRDVKDRVVQYPRRYQLVEVSQGVYDLVPVTGVVTEEGTAINKAYLQPIEDGLDAALEKTGDGKDVTVTFTEAATEAHISSGEKLSILFGKILKKFKNVAPTSHASSANTYGVGTTANFGHCKTINNLTQASHVNGNALSAYQGKVLKDMVDVKLEMVEGSYTGSGVTGRTISLPFTPRIILIFIYDSDNEDAWAIGTKGAIQYGKYCNFFNDSKIVTNGFTVRSGNPGNNNSNIVYDYLAIK